MITATLLNLALLTKPIQQGFRLNPLYLPELFHNGIIFVSFLATIYECERIPVTVSHEAFSRGCIAQFADPSGDLMKSTVLLHPAKPIFRIAVIRFTSMHNAVDKCAVRVVDSLRYFVRGIEMIMPQKNQSENKLLAFCRKIGPREGFSQLSLQGRNCLNPWPWAGPKRRWL